MDSAVTNGHLQVVQWFRANRTEGCSRRAMAAAAESGHSKIIRWFYHHSSEINVTKALLHAASNGHLDIVVWLVRAYPKLVCTQCIRNEVFEGTGLSFPRCKSTAAYQGDLDVVNYINEMHRDKMHFTDPLDCACQVAQGGHLGVIQWIHATFWGAPEPGQGQDVHAD